MTQVQGTRNCGRKRVQGGRKISTVLRGQSLLMGDTGDGGAAGLAGVNAAWLDAAVADALGDGGFAGASTCTPVVVSPIRVIAASGKLGNLAPGTGFGAGVAATDGTLALPGGATEGAPSPIMITGAAARVCATTVMGKSRARLAIMTLAAIRMP